MPIRPTILLLTALAAPIAAVAQDKTRTLEPNDAVALADGAKRGKEGRFAMTVAATATRRAGCSSIRTPTTARPTT